MLKSMWTQKGPGLHDEGQGGVGQFTFGVDRPSVQSTGLFPTGALKDFRGTSPLRSSSRAGSPGSNLKVRRPSDWRFRP